MAIVKCKECGKDVSEDAKTCPHCGIKHPYAIKRYVEIGGNIFFGILIAWFILSGSACEFFGCTPKKDPAEVKAEAAFNELFSSPAVSVNDVTVFGAGGMTIANKTRLNWSRVELILNPPFGNEGFASAAKAIYALATDDIQGFRAPPNSSEMYGPVNAGNQLYVKWDDFLHKETKEKFSPSRYQPNMLILRIYADDSGKMRNVYKVFRRNSAGAWIDG